MLARFFIDRPIFAWVIAIIIMLAGALALTRLPISRYPTIAPPSVTINASYPGASAQAVENSVTQIIEQAMTGLDGLDYMSSASDSNGSVSVTLTFRRSLVMLVSISPLTVIDPPRGVNFSALDSRLSKTCLMAR